MGSWTALENFEIYSNQIVGTIPTSIADMKNLAFLDLGNNRLTGTIPDTLVNLGNLRKFGYFFRCIDFCSLQILSQPYLCISLAELIKLNDNKLGGEIPNGFENLVNLGECHAILISALASLFISSHIFLVLQQIWISAILV
jgi:hypothetical protein